MPNAFLSGAHLYLRPLEREDAAAIVPWFNDPEVIRTLRRYLPLTLIEEQEFIDHLRNSDHDLSLGIALKDGDRLIGATGLHEIDYKNRHAGLGIVIGDKTEWGKGHGTEAARLLIGYAFNNLNMNRVWLHVYEYNARGLRSYEKLGFQREGVLRQDNFRDGRYWDTIVMAILRQDWSSVASAARQPP